VRRHSRLKNVYAKTKGPALAGISIFRPWVVVSACRCMAGLASFPTPPGLLPWREIPRNESVSLRGTDTRTASRLWPALYTPEAGHS
jgi:hypothetical protein